MAAGGIKMVMRMVKKVDRTDQFMKALNGACFAVVKKAAQNIERRVKTTAPYRTGNLRRSYHLQLDRQNLAARVGSDPSIAPYAGYVEFGTSGQTAQPHLGPAGQAEASPFQQEMQAAVWRTVNEWSSGGGK